MEDYKIVDLYWAREERAIAETEKKYGRMLHSLSYSLLSSHEDAEECVNDTYLGAWNSMPPSRPNVLKAFLTVIARRIAIKRYHSNLRKKVIPSEMTLSLSELEDFVIGDEDIGADLDTERLGRVISGFVRALPERRQFIFMSRYYSAEPIDTIASDLGLSRSMINKELAAIRTSLREKLESEGYSI